LGEQINAGLAFPGAAPGRRTPGVSRGEADASVLASLALGRIGTRGADGAVSVRRRERAGCFLYGPFWRLPGGIYRLSFRCEVRRPRWAEAPVVGVEIIARNRDQQAWRDFTAAELTAGAGSLDFAVPQELSLEAAEDARFEFRFLHLGEADLKIRAVDLHRRDVSFVAEPPHWRLLSRLSTTAIGRRGPGASVTARRWVSAGLLLYGGWPYLGLAEGRYRLSLRGRAEPPAMADQPLIAVEVIGGSRWRRASPWPSRSWRVARRETVRLAADDFTAAELNAGAASLEFSVPLELSLESGEAAPFEFRVLYLGEGGATIAGVDLDRLLDDDAAPQAPARWRLLGRMRLGRAAIRTAEGVQVRRDDEPGIFVAGIRPPLRLGAGHYRLTVGAMAGPPRETAQPVLGIAIAARLASSGAAGAPWPIRRVLSSARRELDIADLTAGPATVDFTIPAEAAGSDAAQCDIALYHYGNADLTVTACDLLGVPEIEAMEAALPRAPARRSQIVIVGNCQAYFVHEAFRRAPPLARGYTAKFHFVALANSLHELGKRELAQCDLLLVQDIHDWQHYPLRDFVPDGIEIVKFPMLHFASLWPFDQYNGPGDREAMRREWPDLTFLYLDGLLSRLRHEIPDRETRFRAYRSLDLPDIVNYRHLHDFERRRLLAMDRQFGGAIGEFILANFRERQLFYTTNHPSLEVLMMLMEQLMRRIGIDEPFPRSKFFDQLRRLQVPIHPKVAQALGVRWADETTKYSYEGRWFTWEEYTRSYIAHYG
jgi:hypothetical protein